MSGYKSRYTRNQKRNWVADGVILSLVSSGIIGVALALICEAVVLGLLVGFMAFIFVISIYFSGSP